MPIAKSSRESKSTKNKESQEKQEESHLEEETDEEKSASLSLEKSKGLQKIRKLSPEIINYLKQYSDDKDVDNIIEDLSDHEIKRIEQSFKRNKMGIQASIIQICSPNCESYNKCPLAIAKIEPTGEDCPIEQDLYETRTKEYREAVSQRIQDLGESEINSDRIVETLISDLVEAEIVEYRMNGLLSTAGFIEEVGTLATVDDGVIYTPKEHVALNIKEKYKKRRDILLRQLLATPEMVQRTKRTAKTITPLERVDNTRAKVQELIAKSNRVVEGEIVEDELTRPRKKKKK